jgi:hypothetical protein
MLRAALRRHVPDRRRRPLHAMLNGHQMGTGLTRMLCAFLCLAFLAAPAFGQQDIEQRKIEYLISSVADLRDAVFVRNGTEYDSARAADHLRLKLRNAGGHVGTAEDFIARCASASSISGEKYRIRFADGHSVDTAAFLHEKLAAYVRPATPGDM